MSFFYLRVQYLAVHMNVNVCLLTFPRPFFPKILVMRCLFSALATLRVGDDAMAKCHTQSSRERSKAP